MESKISIDKLKSILESSVNSPKVHAVKYVKENSTMSLKEAIDYVNNYCELIDNGKGTITWFEIGKDNYPPIDEGRENPFKYSVNVFITDGNQIIESSYCYGDSEGHVPFWHLASFSPTHWAHINFPK